MATAGKNDPRTVFGWAMYDWANSAYITIFGAVVAAFFTDSIVPDEGLWGLSGETLWAAVVSVGAIVLFLWMPIIGAIADYSAAKRAFLRVFAVFGAIVTMLVPFVPDGAVLPFLFLVLLTQVGFVGANVFYDGFLPDITTDATIDRVSSRGFAFGYIGGGLYLLLAFVLLTLSGDDGATGLAEATAARIGIFGAGVWWLGFTWFALARFPETGVPEQLPAEYGGTARWRAYASIGFRRTISTGKKLRRFPQILLFVLAFLFYNDGTQTVIAISGAYAEDTLGLELTQIATAFLIVQFIAFFGALGFGVLAGRIGAKRAIIVSLVIWVGLAIGAYFLPEGEALPFYGLAAVVGFVLGGVQALSRSLYGSMIPEEASAEFYGFFSVFSKFSAIWGPLVFAIVSAVTDSGRPAIVSIVVFFIVGMVLLGRVDVDEARASRERWRFEGVEATVD
ncbi:MAG TPA: MFS transporter [Acidimicrobiia bacterium]